MLFSFCSILYDIFLLLLSAKPYFSMITARFFKKTLNSSRFHLEFFNFATTQLAPSEGMWVIYW